VDVECILGGLVSKRNDVIDVISSKLLNAGIVIEFRSKGMGKVYRIINLYDLCGYTNPF